MFLGTNHPKGTRGHFPGAIVSGGNYRGGNFPGANYTRVNSPRAQIYTNGEFKGKTVRRNGYRYKGFGFINSTLSIFSLISGCRCSYSKRSVKHLAKLAPT